MAFEWSMHMYMYQNCAIGNFDTCNLENPYTLYSDEFENKMVKHGCHFFVFATIFVGWWLCGILRCDILAHKNYINYFLLESWMKLTNQLLFLLMLVLKINKIFNNWLIIFVKMAEAVYEYRYLFSDKSTNKMYEFIFFK